MLLAVTVLTLFSACEKVLLNGDGVDTEPLVNFDYLWKKCNENYSYFAVKQIDWDSIYEQYASLVDTDMPDDSLFALLGDMLNELRDDHANLFSPFNTSFYGVEYTGPDNFDWRLVADQYLNNDYNITGPFTHDFLAGGQVAYVRLSSFTRNMSAADLDYLWKKYRDTEGMIFDIRENGGGAIANVFLLLSSWMDATTVTHYSRIKNGPGHNDFSEPAPVEVQPYSGEKYLKQIVVLTDRGTYSSGSLLALAVKALPNVVLLGDTTGGGLGQPNGGQLPNGWTYRFSITQSLTLDLSPEWENGVPPDTTVGLDPMATETDEMIEAAIGLIL